MCSPCILGHYCVGDQLDCESTLEHTGLGPPSYGLLECPQNSTDCTVWGDDKYTDAGFLIGSGIVYKISKFRFLLTSIVKHLNCLIGIINRTIRILNFGVPRSKFVQNKTSHPLKKRRHGYLQYLYRSASR